MKNKITNVCGLLFVVSGTLAVCEVPAKLKVVCGIVSAVSGAIVAYYTGKKPNS